VFLEKACFPIIHSIAHYLNYCLIFLEFAHATDVLYKVPDPQSKDAEEDSDSHSKDDSESVSNPMIQRIFDDIVNIQRKPGAPHEDSSTVEQSSPRIVYMRDFGSVAASASLLVPYLLQALRTRRNARFRKDSFDREGPIQPTVLILGFSETPNTRPDELPDESFLFCGLFRNSRYKNGTKHVSNDLSNGGAALVRILPPLDSKLFTLKNETFPASAFSSAFFLPSLTDVEELSIQRPAIKASPIKHLMSGAAAIFIFPVDSHTEEFRHIEQSMARSRSQAVRNAWMTICLGRRGAVVCEKPLDSISSNHIQTDEQSTPNSSAHSTLPQIDFLDKLRKRTGILHPVSLDRIASIAIGLSSAGSSAPTTAIQVTPALLSRSCQLFVKNLQARSDWTKTVMGHKEHEKEEVDPIVQKVKEATDLNEYERNLLNCIVDGGKFALVS
jgi:hypothetical protein